MDVKWIKLMTDMFDNRKIRYLRRLPEGNSIVLIWVMLLSLAGRCNAGGMIHLTRDIPYTTKMLADELDFEENTVILALKALESLGMISQDPLSVTNWEEYQSTEKLDQIREQTRKRVADHRAKQKALEAEHGEHCSPLQKACNGNVTRYSNVTCNADVTHSNATDIEEEKDIERDIEKNKKARSKDALSVFGEFAKDNHVLAVALADFAQMRKAIKKPLTTRAAELICLKLEKDFREEDWIAVINQSIENSWQGLFPLKDGGNGLPRGFAPRNDSGGGVSRRVRESNAQCQVHNEISAGMMAAAKQMLEEEI